MKNQIRPWPGANAWVSRVLHRKWRRWLQPLLLVLLSLQFVEKGWGFIPGDEFYRYPYIHSYANLHYRFFQNQPSEYEIGIQGRIPYHKISVDRPSQEGLFDTAITSPTAYAVYGLESIIGYTFISRGITRHRYFLGQSWYGEYLQAKIGYGYTHRVNPIASFEHEIPFSLGVWEGFTGRWEFSLFGSLDWRPTDFLPLLGGNIAYLFYTQPRVSGDFINGDSFHGEIPHRMDIAVYRKSPNSFGMRNTYQFNLLNSSTSSLTHLRLLFSWEIFPIKVGLALTFAWKDQVRVSSYTLYHPEWGFDHSLDVGVMNYSTSSILRSDNL